METGQGADVTQLSHPRGVWVDRCGHVYVAVDSGNDRVMRWEKEAKEGTVIVGGNGEWSKSESVESSCGLVL